VRLPQLAIHTTKKHSISSCANSIANIMSVHQKQAPTAESKRPEPNLTFAHHLLSEQYWSTYYDCHLTFLSSPAIETAECAL
jgi:hypothetical protein